MARLADISRAIALVGAIGLVGPSLGCSKHDKQSNDSPKPSEPAAKLPPPGPPPLHCDEFLTRAELTELGLGIDGYGEVASSSEAMSCAFGGIMATIWRGDRYSSIVDGLKANGSSTGVAVEDGPKVGAENQWTTMEGVKGRDGKQPHTLNFLPANKAFTAAITGGDKAALEKLANALLARFTRG